jgi:hypothetical protein
MLGVNAWCPMDPVGNYLCSDFDVSYDFTSLEYSTFDIGYLADALNRVKISDVIIAFPATYSETGSVTKLYTNRQDMPYFFCGIVINVTSENGGRIYAMDASYLWNDDYVRGPLRDSVYGNAHSDTLYNIWIGTNSQSGGTGMHGVRRQDPYSLSFQNAGANQTISWDPDGGSGTGNPQGNQSIGNLLDLRKELWSKYGLYIVHDSISFNSDGKIALVYKLYSTAQTSVTIHELHPQWSDLNIDMNNSKELA